MDVTQLQPQKAMAATTTTTAAAADQPHSQIVHTPIDFSQTALADDYSGYYAQILDNVFTAAECASFISSATSSSPSTTTTGESTWEPAMLDSRSTNPTFRHSDRILHDDAKLASFIFARVQPFLSSTGADLFTPSSSGVHGGEEERRWAEIPWTSASKFPKGKIGRWKLAGLNERLRFLRYGPGHFFRPHVDGMFQDKHQGESGPPVARKSFLTLHLYLNGGEDDGSGEGKREGGEGEGEEGGERKRERDGGPKGGATRFWSKDKQHYIDVEPRVGRVLLFQQRLLLHSGEEVTAGLKYTMRTDVMYELVLEEEPRRNKKKA